MNQKGLVRLYRIAVCDDDPRFLEEFLPKLSKALSSKNIEAETEKFHDTASFLQRAYQGISFDLIFLDIYLGEENGYLFAKRLRSEEIQTDIIFITSTDEYAVMGYDVSPLLYLLKPVRDEQLAYACDIFLKKRRQTQLLLNLSGETISLGITDLLYCEVLGHRVSLHLLSGDVMKFRYSLSDLEKQLPDSLFIRSHQSYLVNMSHISSIIRYKLTLSTGETLPVSQSRYTDLQNRFIQYASRQNI